MFVRKTEDIDKIIYGTSDRDFCENKYFSIQKVSSDFT